MSFYVLFRLFCFFVCARWKLKKGHWNEVAFAMNSKKTEGDSTMKTGHQCKLKWNNLRRRYVVEKAAQNSTSGVKSTWPYYNKIDDIIRASPKVMSTSFSF